MKTLEITEASLSEYDPEIETWVLTRNGKPVAAVVPIRSGMDAETFAMSHNPTFIEIFNRSWKSIKEKGGTPLEEVRKRHEHEEKPSRRKSSKLTRRTG